MCVGHEIQDQYGVTNSTLLTGESGHGHCD